MYKFGDISLGANEFTFYLETNAPIDTARLAQFLARFSRPPKRGKFRFPEVEVDILDLRSGSLFGRCGAKYKHPSAPLDDKRLAAEYRRLRRETDGRVTMETAPASKDFVADAISASASGHERALTAMLVLGVIAAITSPHPGNDADLAAAMMDLDGISHFEFRTADHRWQVYQSDVPEYELRKNEGPRPERERRIREGIVPRREDEEDYLTLGGEALTVGGQRLRVPRSTDSARPAAAPEAILRASAEDAQPLPEPLLRKAQMAERKLERLDMPRRGRDFVLLGTVSVDGEVYRIRAEPGTGLQEPIILVPADDFVYAEGGRYEVRGKAYRFTPDETLFVAKRSREWPE